MKREEKENVEKRQTKESAIVTQESFCAVGALFSVLAFFVLCTGEWVFGEIGFTVRSFLTGLFGYMAYPALLGTGYLCVTALMGKRFIKNRKAFTCALLAAFFAALVAHTACTVTWNAETYLADCFYAGNLFPAATVCGFVGGLVALAISSVTTGVGAIVIFSLSAVFFAYLCYVFIQKQPKTAKTEDKDLSQTQAEPTVIPVEIPLSQPNVSTPSAPANTETANRQIVYGEATLNQRPAVTLSDEPAMAESKPVGGAFSPFGTAENMRNVQDKPYDGYTSSREFLFGSTPAENYKRNLIFDPNARVNNRPSMQAQPINSDVQSGYTPSYTAAYQNAVNNGETERPQKIFTDYTQRPTENTYKSENIQPLRPIQEMPTETAMPPAEIPVSQPSYLDVDENGRDAFSYTERVEEDFSQPVAETPSTERAEREETEYRRHDYMDLFSPENPNVFGNDDSDRAFASETFAREESRDGRDDFETLSRRDDEISFRDRDDVFEDNGEYTDERDGMNIFDEPEDDMYALRSDRDDLRGTEMDFSRESRIFEEPAEQTPTVTSIVSPEPKLEPKPVPKPEPPAPPKPRIIRPYVHVPLDDFDCRDVEPTKNAEEVEETKANIIGTLEEFKITGASVASVTFGPTVVRYNITIPRNISPKKVVALDASIAISLHSSGVNIYPNYEDGVVSIEVPHKDKDRQFVQLGCMLSGDTFVNAKSSSLMFAMGKDVGNRKVYGDISKMIHMLVAGSSGSGKSVFLGSLIISLIYKYSPEELRLILIDPKKTEFVLYNNLPHLMINEIITDANKAVQSLSWAIGEMNRRYGLFEQMSRAGTYVVNLDQYNSHIEKNQRLPKIVIIIDELADLMLAAKKDIEDKIQNLTQKARAAGIHLVVATQRPSTDVITGVIKSNLFTRIAFAVATDVDSGVILDQSGAQNLLGKGDFLYTMQGINTPVRVQSAFISSEDSQRVVNFIKANNEAYYDEDATAYINNTRSGGDSGSFGSPDEVEGVYIDALRYVILSNSASISLIQRKCSIGYNKAGKIVEWMEEMGYISSFDGAKARKVLISKEEFESKYGAL